MLSILIPVYNCDIVNLVSELRSQADREGIPFEILALEDGSTLFVEKNRVVSGWEHCRHLLLPENSGRSVARNRLAEEARYGHLLFLDSDTQVDNPGFIRNYLPYCTGEKVVLGGISCPSFPPRNSLHGRYGEQRGNSQEGKKHASRMFTTPNFLIPKAIFEQVRFDETIQGYGHEDTVFGIVLKRKGFDFQYIDNPVLHAGLEDNPAFLRKTRTSLHNLWLLHASGKYPELENSVKILSFYLRIKRLRLAGIIAFFYRAFRKMIERNLTGSHPSLSLFDFYKLAVLITLTNPR